MDLEGRECLIRQMGPEQTIVAFCRMGQSTANWMTVPTTTVTEWIEPSVVVVAVFCSAKNFLADLQTGPCLYRKNLLTTAQPENRRFDAKPV